MKKHIISALAAFTLSIAAFAQNGNVGIGTTTPNADAKLDITATNKGLLLPRVALTGTANAAPLSAHVAGMTVYNTKDTLDVTKGTYYNNGIKWIKIGDAANAWSLTGNAGTTPGTNYLGTKDSNALVFKTNATNDTSRKMVIMPNGYVGIGTSAPVTNLDIVSQTSDNYLGSDISFINYSTSKDIGPGTAVLFMGGRGTKANPVNLKKDDLLAGINFAGYYNNALHYSGLSSIAAFYKGDSATQLSNLQFWTSGKPVMIIDHKNNLGISTQNPQAKLHIDGARDNSDTLAPTTAQAFNDMVVTINGSVGMGTATPTARLELKGRTFKLGQTVAENDPNLYLNPIIESDSTDLMLSTPHDELGLVKIRDANSPAYFGINANGHTKIYARYQNGAQMQPSVVNLDALKLMITDSPFVQYNSGNVKLEVSGKVKAENLIFTGLPGYATQGDAEADANLPAGSLYKINSTKQVYLK